MKNALSSQTKRASKKEEHQAGRAAVPFDPSAGWIRWPRQEDEEEEEGVAHVSASSPDEEGGIKVHQSQEKKKKCQSVKNAAVLNVYYVENFSFFRVLLQIKLP